MDYIMVEAKQPLNHISGLDEVFMVIRSQKMRLNPKKCVFSVNLGKFLGNLVSPQGIKANLDKIEALVNMKSPSNLKGI